MKRHSFSRCLWWFSVLALTLGSPASRPTRDADYWAQRARILADESRSALGGKLQLGEDERAANNILMEAKREEIDRGFLDPGGFLPARNFLTVAEEIRRSPTFQIIREMPKGAVLHAHDTALVSADFVYENITFRENLHICRPEGGLISLRFIRSANNDTTCASPAGWELVADLRANETIAEEVNSLIRNALYMVAGDPATAYPDINAVWATLMDMFEIRRPLLSYLPVFSDLYYQSLVELYEDNVIYVEFRSAFLPLYDLDGNTYEPLEVGRLCKSLTDRFVDEHPDFIGAKLIYAKLRLVDAAQMDRHLTTAAALRKEFPDFVVGFDLVGQEEKGEPLVRYADKFRAISPDIRLFFHAGETKWNGLSTDENLIDAVLLNTTRIGHGFAITKHPKVLELAKEREIAIEVNPISNQVLGHVQDLRNHPASFLFAHDYPVVVSCDDPGVWGAVGLSYDFYEAFVGIMSRSADIRALKQLAINSIKYSAMSSAEKTRAFTIWEGKWTTFISDLARNNSRVS